MNTVSIFSLENYPSNLLRDTEWHRLRRSLCLNSLDATMRRFAAQSGGALYARDDDALVVYTRLESGKISRKTHKPLTWRWE